MVVRRYLTTPRNETPSSIIHIALSTYFLFERQPWSLQNTPEGVYLCRLSDDDLPSSSVCDQCEKITCFWERDSSQGKRLGNKTYSDGPRIFRRRGQQGQKKGDVSRGSSLTRRKRENWLLVRKFAKKKAPWRGIEPRSSAWQAEILTTILPGILSALIGWKHVSELAIWTIGQSPRSVPTP